MYNLYIYAFFLATTCPLALISVPLGWNLGYLSCLPPSACLTHTAMPPVSACRAFTRTRYAAAAPRIYPYLPPATAPRSLPFPRAFHHRPRLFCPLHASSRCTTTTTVAPHGDDVGARLHARRRAYAGARRRMFSAPSRAHARRARILTLLALFIPRPPPDRRAAIPHRSHAALPCAARYTLLPAAV